MTEEKIRAIALDLIMEQQADCMKDATEKELYYLMAYNDGVIEVTNRLIGSLVKQNECKTESEHTND